MYERIRDQDVHEARQPDINFRDMSRLRVIAHLVYARHTPDSRDVAEEIYSDLGSSDSRQIADALLNECALEDPALQNIANDLRASVTHRSQAAAAH